MVHLVDEKRLIRSVVWNVENSPLKVVELHSHALLLGHEVSKLLLIVNICQNGHCLVH